MSLGGPRLDMNDAAAACGLGLLVAGLALAAGALADSSVPARLNGADRIVVGLAHVQTGELLTLAVALGVTAIALRRGARLGGWDEPVARLSAGVAAGAFGLAVAVILAATVVALHNRFNGVVVTGNSVLGEWLRQAVAGAGFAVVFAVEVFVLASPVEVDERLVEVVAEELPQPAPEIRALQASPAAVAPAAHEPVQAHRPPQPAGAAPLAGRAQDIYRSRLAFSPRAADARRLVDQVAELERDGRLTDAARLVDELQAM